MFNEIFSSHESGIQLLKYHLAKILSTRNPTALPDTVNPLGIFDDKVSIYAVIDSMLYYLFFATIHSRDPLCLLASWNAQVQQFSQSCFFLTSTSNVELCVNAVR